MFEVNKKLLPLKANYFLHLGSIAPFFGFCPTIARQLGYSLPTYGTIMMSLAVISTLLIPVTGVIIDRYPVKRLLFLTSILMMTVSSILYMFVPKLPLEAAVEMKCDSRIVLTVYHSNVQPNKSIFIDQNVDESVTCKLKCQDAKLEKYEINTPNNQSDMRDVGMTNIKGLDFLDYRYSTIDVALNLSDTEYDESSYLFHVLSVKINGTELPSTTCQSHLKTFCYINSSNKALMDVATSKTYRGNVLKTSKFWIYLFTIIIFALSCTEVTYLQNAICIDILGSNSEDFGRQKCWGSLGWGLFSIIIGWLVDLCSTNKQEKDYSPVFYSGVILTLLNFIFSIKIKTTETKKSKGKMKSVSGMFSKHYVIAFFTWIIFTSFLHTIITHFLFWYMDDLVAENNDQSQRAWLKTLQGFAQGVQCFAGEVPFFFWSGWFIRKLSHTKCMALSLGAMAVRMYLYTVISNPIWIILIELLNGISYALAFAVKMSYAKLISPPDVFNTIIGITMFCDLIGDSLGSLLGGFIFDAYGGFVSFRLFALFSALMCVLNILSNIFGFTKEIKNCEFVRVSMENDTKDSIHIES